MSNEAVMDCPKCDGDSLHLRLVDITNYADEIPHYMFVPECCSMCRGRGKIVIVEHEQFLH